MSIEAITWVSRQAVRPSSVKFVLFAFANCANETRVCFPSIEYVAAFTSQDRKTVISAIAQLAQLGYLEDTGKRVGRTGQIKVYRLKSPNSGTIEESRKRDSSSEPEEFQIRDSSDSQRVPFSDSNSTVLPSKESRFSVERVPKTGHGTVSNRKEPSKEPSKEPLPPAAANDPVKLIFDHWRQVHEHPKSVLDKKRRTLINARLKDFDEQQIKDSISGYKHSPHHMGKNEHGTVYDSIELLLKDTKHIEMGLAFFRKPPGKSLQMSPAEAAWKRVRDEATVEKFREPATGESLTEYRDALKRHTDEKARKHLAELHARMSGATKSMGGS